MGVNAWVTLATNDSYSLGALVLAHSLKQAGTQQKLAVLVTPGVTNAMREKLKQVYDLVQEVNILDSRDETNLRLLKRPELGVTFTKLHCWRLTQFDKCVFLDADTLVLQNCDELFEREELSAAPDVGWPDCFNSGVFVYRPSNETYEKLIQFALERGSFDGGDQGLLNLYFSDWAHKDISKHLPFIYNLCSTAGYSYLPAFKQFGGNAKIIHFIGATKPWLQYFDTESKQVHPSGDAQHLREVLQLWWNIFCSLIHPNLTTDMSGLAGAFAQLTLGVPRTAEQAALDDHLRRQGWEVGNIDYLGRDSFDNIWSKICATLSAVPEPTVKPKDPSPPVTSEVTEQPPAEVVAKEVPAPETQSAGPPVEPPVPEIVPKVTPESETKQVEAPVTTPSVPETPQQPSEPQIPTPATVASVVAPTSEPVLESPQATVEALKTPLTETQVPVAAPPTVQVPESTQATVEAPVTVAAPASESVPESPQVTSQAAVTVAEVPLVAPPTESIPESLKPSVEAPLPVPEVPVAAPQSEKVPETPKAAVEAPVTVAEVPVSKQVPETTPQAPTEAPAPAAVPVAAPQAPESPQPIVEAPQTVAPVTAAVEAAKPAASPIVPEAVPAETAPKPAPVTSDVAKPTTEVPAAVKAVPVVPETTRVPKESTKSTPPVSQVPPVAEVAKPATEVPQPQAPTETPKTCPVKKVTKKPKESPKVEAATENVGSSDPPPAAGSEAAAGTPTPPPRKSGAPKKTTTKPKK